MRKFVWLDLETGCFSNTWDESEHTPEELAQVIKDMKDQPFCKLIEYTCHTDETSQFMNRMRIA